MHIRPVKCLKYVNVISLKTWNGFESLSQIS